MKFYMLKPPDFNASMCIQPNDCLRQRGSTHLSDSLQAHVQIRARLAAEVSGGSFYEAQQTYKATYNRYKIKDDWANALAILQAS
jgi:hypothetical protein